MLKSVQQTRSLVFNRRQTDPTSAACWTRSTVSKAADAQRSTFENLKRVSDLPVEEGWPIVGMAPELVSEMFDVDHLFEKHGGPFVMNTSFMSGRAVCFNGEPEIREIQKDKELSMTVSESLLRVVSNGNIQGVQSADESKSWRAAITKVLAPTPVMGMHVPLMLPLVEARVRRRAQAGEQTLWFEEARRIAFAVATQAVLADLISSDDCDQLFEEFREMSAGAVSLNFGLRDGVPGTPYHKAVHAAQRIQDFLLPPLREALRGEEALLASGTVLGQLVVALREEGADIMHGSLEERAVYFVTEAMTLMFAGTDTTSHSICQAAALLSKHPEWLEKMWEEQKTLMAIHGDALTSQVLQKSTLVAAVAQEVMRCGRGNLIQQRMATSDTVVGGVRVPKGTPVWMLPAQSLHGTGEGSFNPAQWLCPATPEASASEASSSFPASTGSTSSTQSDGRSDTGGCPFSSQIFKQKKAQRTRQVLFGIGPRTCPGQNLAVAELSAVLMVLTREVKGIEMSKEEQERRMAPIFPHSTGMPLRFVPRQPHMT